MGEFTGHSVLLILYVWATSRHMCKWYHMTNAFLMLIHINDLLYYQDIPAWQPLYFAIAMNLFAIISFLIYRSIAGITKLLRL